MENNNQENKSLLIKPFSQMHKGALIYYVLSFAVLFFNVFVLNSENISGTTYKVGYQEFAIGIGWIYYIANAVGILTVVSPLLHFLEGIGTKLISVANLVVSGLLLFKIIPDAINPASSIVSFIGNGELGTGFWLIMGLHILAVLIFWFSFIRSISKKNKKRKHKNEVKQEKKEVRKEEKAIDQALARQEIESEIEESQYEQ